MKQEMSEIIRKELGETFRQAREKAGLTQVKVAEMVEMDVNYYARIERGLGNPSYEKVHGIMKALKIESLDIK
jgi:transcriptional regulator with XRE-family HTH domain